jgi:hypothetical protein
MATRTHGPRVKQILESRKRELKKESERLREERQQVEQALDMFRHRRKKRRQPETVEG